MKQREFKKEVVAPVQQQVERLKHGLQTETVPAAIREMCLQAATALVGLGRGKEALDVLDEHVSKAEIDASIELLNVRIEALGIAGRFQEMQTAAEQLVAVVPKAEASDAPAQIVQYVQALFWLLRAYEMRRDDKKVEVARQIKALVEPNSALKGAHVFSPRLEVEVSLWYIEALNTAGDIYDGRYLRELENLLSFVEILAENDPFLKAWVLHVMGDFYGTRMQLDKALEFYNKSLDVAGRMGFPILILYNRADIAGIWADMPDRGSKIAALNEWIGSGIDGVEKMGWGYGPLVGFRLVNLFSDLKRQGERFSTELETEAHKIAHWLCLQGKIEVPYFSHMSLIRLITLAIESGIVFDPGQVKNIHGLAHFGELKYTHPLADLPISLNIPLALFSTSKVEELLQAIAVPAGWRELEACVEITAGIPSAGIELLLEGGKQIRIADEVSGPRWGGDHVSVIIKDEQGWDYGAVGQRKPGPIRLRIVRNKVIAFFVGVPSRKKFVKIFEIEGAIKEVNLFLRNYVASEGSAQFNKDLRADL